MIFVAFVIFVPLPSAVVSLAQGQQHEFSNHPAGLQLAVCVGGARERELGVDDRLDLAAIEQRPHLTLEGARDRTLLGSGPRPQRRSGDGEAPLQDRTQSIVDFAAAIRPICTRRPLRTQGTPDCAGDTRRR